MTVKQLIDYLQTAPPESPILIRNERDRLTPLTPSYIVNLNDPAAPLFIENYPVADVPAMTEGMAVI